jgi:predicted component of type VI protein secretion system
MAQFGRGIMSNRIDETKTQTRKKIKSPFAHNNGTLRASVHDEVVIIRSLQIKSAILEDLVVNPALFSFSSAMFLLKTFFPKKEIYIQSKISLAIKTNDIEAIQIRENIIYVMVNFISLAGAQGPLPLSYAEMIRWMSNSKPVRDFLNIFNNRIACITNNIAQKYNPEFNVDNQVIQTHERFIMSCVSGICDENNDRDVSANYAHEIKQRFLTNNDLMQYASFYWSRVRNIYNLRNIIESFFQVNSHVSDGNSRWVEIPLNMTSRLCNDASKNVILIRSLQKLSSNQGASYSQSPYNNILGKNCVLGSKYRAYDEIIVRLDVDFDLLTEFLPTHFSQSFQKLNELIKSYLSFRSPFRIQFRIRKKELHNRAMLLGWTSATLTDSDDYHIINVNDSFYYK